ncbi:uncharacterized protein TNCV_1283791 [Trichonephila clavipes]|uniref:Uncharacterized protein n=1 Tax=Trichonephila clavipes TaxID=2585209 RepID=A0A8X6SL64_TRICX|nr:uncharacterized protein TNCV_1283791 [Trichonephila clavipes]
MYRATTSKQSMGDLPTHRVTPSKPFSVCGVDYAGPINILRYRGRGAKTTKGYIALFVCFVTKALHLELVSDLTSEAFIASLKRFCARRGALSTFIVIMVPLFCWCQKKIARNI